MKHFFCIIAKGDVPIYQTSLSATASKMQKDDLVQFILHASLDAVDAKLWSTPTMYLKTVDKFNDVSISAFVTAGHIKFLLLHDPHKDDLILKAFFYEVYELYIKVIVNPFYEKNSAITSKIFDEKVRALGDKYLGRI